MAATTLLSDNGVTSGITGYQLTGGNDGTLQLQTTTAGGAATTAMTINTSQNVGIGVSPNAWGSGYTALQMAGPSMWGSAGLSHWTTNTYYDGTNYKYIASTPATDYYQYGGVHVWRTAASGTAGANITTFNESMRIDANGNVGIGTNSPNLNTNGTVLHINNSTATRAAIVHMTNAESGSAVNNGLVVGKWSDGTNYFFDYGAYPVHIGSNSLSRIVIDASGRTRMPYQPSFSAYSPESTGSAAIVKYINTRSNVGSHYDTSTGVYTAPIAGVYVFTFNALMNTNAEYCRLLFRWNGTSSTQFGDTLIGGVNGTWNAGWSYLCVGLTWVVSLGQGDTVSVWNDGPTTTYGTGYGTFSGYMLG